MQNDTKTVSKIIAQTLKKKYPSMSDKNANLVAREVVLGPKNRMIEVEKSQKLSKEDLSFMLAKELDTPSLSFNELQAQSMERLNSGTDSVEEYFSWLNETTDILRHMNDGYVTQQDAIEREAFLQNTDQREAELMVCLGLYSSCQSSAAREKVKFIRYKLQKLREMRSAISFLTKKGTDVETTRSEFDSAKPYYAYFKGLKEVEFGYDMSDEKKEKIGVRFHLDADLKEGFDYDALLKNKLLDEMAFEDQKQAVQTLYSSFEQEVDDNSKEFTGR